MNAWKPCYENAREKFELIMQERFEQEMATYAAIRRLEDFKRQPRRTATDISILKNQAWRVAEAAYQAFHRPPPSPFERGSHDTRTYGTASENPYSRESIEWEQWERGHEEAIAMILEDA